MARPEDLKDREGEAPQQVTLYCLKREDRRGNRLDPPRILRQLYFVLAPYLQAEVTQDMIANEVPGRVYRKDIDPEHGRFYGYPVSMYSTPRKAVQAWIESRRRAVENAAQALERARAEFERAEALGEQHGIETTLQKAVRLQEEAGGPIKITDIPEDAR